MILTQLTQYRDIGLLILRLGIGASFVSHGLPKLLGGPEMWTMVGSAMSNFGIHFWHPAWGFMAGTVEFLGGLLLIAGFLFRPACFFLASVMLVAMIYHLSSPVPAVRQAYSHAMEMMILFISLILIGPGRYSVDRK